MGESEEEFSADITAVLTKFQAKEGAENSSWKYVNESRRTCRVADCIWEELNITNVASRSLRTG